MKSAICLAVLAGLFQGAAVLAAVPAFPGAEGFAANITGGRGGAVCHVTSLKDSGVGSFRDAVSQGPRIVVFDVGGYINLASEVHVANDITIAGQTAPGDGIGIYGSGVSLSHSRNIIVRFMRFRQGLSGGAKKSAVNITGSDSLMLDHISVQWGRWDTVDMGGTNGTITCQNSIIGEGIAPQRFGCLCQVDYITFSHNLWINNHSRNPKSKGHVQYVNNIVYNYGIGFVGGHSGADHYHDIINNYFIKGPTSGSGFLSEFANTDKVYQSGNFVDLNLDGQLNGRPIVEGDFPHSTPSVTPEFAAKPFLNPPVPVTVDDAVTAYKRVVSDVGASLHRDAVDARLITELTSLGKLGKVISDPAEVGGPGVLKGGTAPTDTDGDGMPDFWEAATGSDPKVADSGKPASSGYTPLEEYLNWLAAPHAMGPAGSPLEIDLRQYASGFESTATYTVAHAANGFVAIEPDGHTARFVPAAGYTGRASFNFTANDGSSISSGVQLLFTPASTR